MKDPKDLGVAKGVVRVVSAYLESDDANAAALALVMGISLLCVAHPDPVKCFDWAIASLQMARANVAAELAVSR